MNCNACARFLLCDRKECKYKSFRELKDYGVPKIIIQGRKKK